MREAMTRALRVKWVREGKDEVVAEFPEGWTAVRPESGPTELRDASGVVRFIGHRRTMPHHAYERHVAAPKLASVPNEFFG